MATRATCLSDLNALIAWLQAEMTAPSPVSDPATRAAQPAAVLLPLYAGGSGSPHLLFTERAATLRRHSGEISFPGGRSDLADAGPRATALREAEEEIGLNPAKVTILGELPAVFTFVTNYLITPVIGHCLGNATTLAPLVNAAEVARVIDAPLAVLADPQIHHIEQWTRQGRTHPVHFYTFGDTTIWGATAHILTQFLSLLPPS